MNVDKFLHKLLNKAIHKTRIILLSQVIGVIIQLKQLKLTSVGRGFKGITEKSGIRKIDRCLKNSFFQKKNIQLYKEITHLVVGSTQRPEIIVDWTKLPNVNEYAIRAALSAEGRAITLYEEVHPKKKEGNADVHKNFLKKLKLILPAHCKPIIVTDAGFKNPWFKAVFALGWDYVGRVRGLTHYSTDGKAFKPCHELHKKASFIPTALGDMTLSKKGSLSTFFYIVKGKIKGFKKRDKNGKISKTKDSLNYSRSHREPWLLVSSLTGYQVAKKVVAIYKRRMTIEEGFRDLKSTQYGFSFTENITLKRERLIVWLMMAALASLVAWITGFVAEQEKLQYQFQANTIKHRRVLSFFYLGCQIIRKEIELFIDLEKIKFTNPIYSNENL